MRVWRVYKMSVKKVYFYQITLYDKSEKEISFLELKKIFSDIIEIELPLPNAETLEHVFGWKESEILDTLIKRNLNLNVVVKGIPRSMITFGADETKGLIQCITSHLNEYRKAKMKARDKKEKLKDYNFFEDNFSYPIDIVEYHIVNYERVYYTVEELVEIYKRNIVSAYLENKEILRTIIGR